MSECHYKRGGGERTDQSESAACPPHPLSHTIDMAFGDWSCHLWERDNASWKSYSNFIGEAKTTLFFKSLEIQKKPNNLKWSKKYWRTESKNTVQQFLWKWREYHKNLPKHTDMKTKNICTKPRNFVKSCLYSIQ
jgi:hypothetical protein